MNLSSLALKILKDSASLVIGYCLFLGALTLPSLQRQVIYLNKVTLTWFKDVNIPEQWGFLRNQVTPFFLRTPDGQRLHAWHVLPLEQYRRHQQELLAEQSGLVLDVESRVSFRLLRNDPDAWLVIYLHGAAGTLASGYRPPSYRALYAGAPDKIHVLAIDYRGFGQSTGTPSEQGLLTDALTLVDWAMNVAGIPASRIVVFAQSLGTAVATSMAHHLCMKNPSVLFAGMVFVAPFRDVKMLTATYKLGGMIPILSLVANFLPVLDYLNTFIRDKWPSAEKLHELIQSYSRTENSDSRYSITLIHAKDDYTIHWSHTEMLFWYAVNASVRSGVTRDELERHKAEQKLDLGAGGRLVDWEGEKGEIREIITKHGKHDITMSYPVVSLAVLRAFSSSKHP